MPTATMMDVFAPCTEPARTIYDAFQQEAQYRRGRTVEEWTARERQAVHDAAVSCASRMSLAPPTLEQVCACERYAMGSADYGAKWAHGVARVMQTGRQ